MNNIKGNIISAFLVSALTSLLILFLYHFVVTKSDTIQDERARALAVAEREVTFSDRFRAAFGSSVPTDFISAAEAGRKAVVYIRSQGQPTSGYNARKQGQNSGSGVLISNDGYIITNQHVINDASQVDVTLDDNRTFSARVAGSDSGTDLALLKIEATGLDFLVFGDSDSLQIGEWVMAVGNPFRLQSSVTAGIVSAKARSLDLYGNQGIESFIQTDAAINPGNSGGALINTRGDLVGICTAILSESGSYEGFSFAIPSNLARKVARDLMQHGVVQRGWLGMEIEKVTTDAAKEAGLSDVSGVYISSVSRGGGAAECGLMAGDIIISIDNKKVTNPPQFMELTGIKSPGDKVTLVIVRKGKTLALEATLKNHLNTTDAVGIMSAPEFAAIGIEVRNLDRYEKSMISDAGVMVVSVKLGSIVAETKMEPGYVITRVNNRSAVNAGNLRKILEENRGQTIIFEGFYPKYPGEYPYTFRMPD